MKQLRYAALGLLLFVAACAQLGLTAPKSFEEKLAVGYATVTQVRTSAATLVTARKISPDDAQNVQAQADNARTGLDIARRLGAVSGDAKLVQVMAGLSLLTDYLKFKEK